MHNNTIKFYKYGKAMTIMGLVLILMLSIFFIVLIIITSSLDGRIVCGIMSLIFIVVILYVLFSPFYVKLDADSVTEINAFGKIKKTHELKCLKEIRIIRGRTRYLRYLSGDYLYFNFTEKDFSDYKDADLATEDDITLLAYTEKTIAIIKEFTDVPIIDMRKKRKK